MNNSLAYTSVFAISLYASTCRPNSKIVQLMGFESEQRPLPPKVQVMPEIICSRSRRPTPVDKKPFYEDVPGRHRNNRANYKIVYR